MKHIARNQILGFGRRPTGLTGPPKRSDQSVWPEPKSISLSHTLLCEVLDNLNIVYQSSLAFFLNKDHQNRAFLQFLSGTGLTGPSNQSDRSEADRTLFFSFKSSYNLFLSRSRGLLLMI